MTEVTIRLPYGMIEIREYLDATGHSPYGKWFNRLNAQAAAMVVIAMTRMGLGNLSNSKGVGAGVHECRIEFGPRLPCLLQQGG